MNNHTIDNNCLRDAAFPMHPGRFGFYYMLRLTDTDYRLL